MFSILVASFLPLSFLSTLAVSTVLRNEDQNPMLGVLGDKEDYRACHQPPIIFNPPVFPETKISKGLAKVYNFTVAGACYAARRNVVREWEYLNGMYRDIQDAENTMLYLPEEVPIEAVHVAAKVYLDWTVPLQYFIANITLSEPKAKGYERDQIAGNLGSVNYKFHSYLKMFTKKLKLDENTNTTMRAANAAVDATFKEADKAFNK